MRPLKFRRRVGDKFYYWGVGVDSCTFVGPISGAGFNAKNTIHQQFTGIHDKTNKEVWEGDIVSVDDGDGWEVGKGFIEYGNGSFVVNIDGDFEDIDDPRILKVIGNIFDGEGGE